MTFKFPVYINACIIYIIVTLSTQPFLFFSLSMFALLPLMIVQFAIGVCQFFVVLAFIVVAGLGVVGLFVLLFHLSTGGWMIVGSIGMFVCLYRLRHRDNRVTKVDTSNDVYESENGNENESPPTPVPFRRRRRTRSVSRSRSSRESYH